jgi:succinate-semialdehyde dehydrogenase/glutarate-semialdehyde dehydrogenase
MATITSINPATGQSLASFETLSQADIDAALDKAVAAQRAWAQQPVETRQAVLRSLAKTLRDSAATYAALITAEMGKPMAEALAEIEKCAWTCDHYAEHGPAYLASEPVETSASRSYVAFDPLGVVLAIMPWNFPFWQFFRFAAPAIMAGNGMLLKHASNVPQCAVAIERVCADAGLPAGLMRTLLIGADQVEALIADPRVAAVTLTGSSEVGAKVAAQAGGELKKQVLELGGSDPFIVLADADIDAAAKAAATSRFRNAGQSCIAAKRFIVVDEIADAFTAAFQREIEALVVGDPTSEASTVGPMARDNLRQDLIAQVDASVKLGARIVTGGHALDGPGFFYAPTLLDHVTTDMPVFTEETFGPVAALIRVKDVEEAVRLANDTEYGLGAAIWSRDTAKAQIIARRIEAGSVFINAVVASDARVPFGGVKKSGYGRELGALGLREFTNIKTVWIG